MDTFVGTVGSTAVVDSVERLGVHGRGTADGNFRMGCEEAASA